MHYVLDTRGDKVWVWYGRNGENVPTSAVLAEALDAAGDDLDPQVREVVEFSAKALRVRDAKIAINSHASVLWFALGRALLKGERLHKCRICGASLLTADAKVRFCVRHRPPDGVPDSEARAYARTRQNHARTGNVPTYAEWADTYVPMRERRRQRAKRARQARQDEEHT